MDKVDKYREVLYFILGSLNCDYVVSIESCDSTGRKGSERCRSCLIKDEINKVLGEVDGTKNLGS